MVVQVQLLSVLIDQPWAPKKPHHVQSHITSRTGIFLLRKFRFYFIRLARVPVMIRIWTWYPLAWPLLRMESQQEWTAFASTPIGCIQALNWYETTSSESLHYWSHQKRHRFLSFLRQFLPDWITGDRSQIATFSTKILAEQAFQLSTVLQQYILSLRIWMRQHLPNPLTQWSKIAVFLERQTRSLWSLLWDKWRRSLCFSQHTT